MIAADQSVRVPILDEGRGARKCWLNFLMGCDHTAAAVKRGLVSYNAVLDPGSSANRWRTSIIFKSEADYVVFLLKYQ